MKSSTVYTCQQCGHESGKWYGRCPECGEWNSFVEGIKSEVRNSKFESSSKFKVQNKFKDQNSKPQLLSDVKHIEIDRLKSGVGEFDRVMGGGIVPGSVTLLAGDPGIGKSTLLLHILSRIGGLYVAGEESAEQVKLRAARVGIKGENIEIFAETEVERIVEVLSSKFNPPAGGQSPNQVPNPKSKSNEHINLQYPIHNVQQGVSSKRYQLQAKSLIMSLVIIDSIQTLTSMELNSMAGSVGQIRYSAEQLISIAKTRHIPMIIIGHVTKEGTIAGPKILEHMVDTVLYLEGERFASARILRTLKNRFGAVEEVGIFEMGEVGLTEVTNPSKLFLSDRVENVPGSVVTVVMEGSRPLLLEIQALTVPTQLAIPRRVANGFDYNRLQLLVAILQKRMNVPLGTVDVFVNVSGGFTIEEPGADVAVCLAILSSFHNIPLDPKIAAFGEVGLLGEIRAIGGGERRESEAKRLGYGKIINSIQYKQLLTLRTLFNKK